MATRRKRRRHEERLEEEEPGREPDREAVQEKEHPREREDTPADKVLELQKTAGNRAVGAALSRWGLPWIPLALAPQWPKEPQLIIDGKVIPLQSWSWSDHSPGAGGAASSTGPGKVDLNEVNVMTKLGDHSAELALKTARGDPVKTVIIVMPGKDGKGITLTFTDVLISGYSISGDAESWSLSFTKKELSQSPPQAQPRP